MVRRRGKPAFGELVVCKITKINPNSCECHLDEYNKEGMVHISEVTSGWVRDIRSFLKAGQTVVAKVMNTGEPLSLSLKRVDLKQENDKIREFKLNQRAEKLLELAAKALGKTLDKAYEEVGFLLQEKFQSMYDGFKSAISDPTLLKRRGIPDQWITVIKEIAEKNIEQKEFTFSAKLHVRSLKGNGIIAIRNALESVRKSGIDVHYIAAPNYLAKYKSLNAKKGQKEFEEKLDALKSAKDVEASYELIKA